MSKAKPLEVVQLGVDDLVPNPWNVNRMSTGMRKKLKAYLRREGLVEPMVVRPHPAQDSKYQILGGFHRWQICKDELGYKAMPCVVVEGLDEKRAKILSINLNSMSGQPVPSLLSDLLMDLGKTMALPDMEASLPWDQSEIQDFQALMQIPEGFADQLEDEADEAERNAPNVLTVVLDNEQWALWQRAVEATTDAVGPTRNTKSRTLEVLCRSMLEAESEEERE